MATYVSRNLDVSAIVSPQKTMDIHPYFPVPCSRENLQDFGDGIRSDLLIISGLVSSEEACAVHKQGFCGVGNGARAVPRPTATTYCCSNSVEQNDTHLTRSDGLYGPTRSLMSLCGMECSHWLKHHRNLFVNICFGENAEVGSNLTPHILNEMKSHFSKASGLCLAFQKMWALLCITSVR